MLKVIKTYIKKSMFPVYEKSKSLFRFIAVGCINTGVDFLAFTILHRFGTDKFICQVAAYSLGIINSFVMNKLWTFNESNTKVGTVNQIFRFTAINIISLGISLLGLRVLNESYGINIYISKVFITAIAQAVNYTGYKLLVFSNERGELA
ncbi:MAG: GtrA family protein [Bacteroidota bacterium]|nr:GtrA family protein [Bacteroidota bacterium]